MGWLYVLPTGEINISVQYEYRRQKIGTQLLDAYLADQKIDIACQTMTIGGASLTSHFIASVKDRPEYQELRHGYGYTCSDLGQHFFDCTCVAKL